jgi:hypothetical protein
MLLIKSIKYRGRFARSKKEIEGYGNKGIGIEKNSG